MDIIDNNLLKIRSYSVHLHIKKYKKPMQLNTKPFLILQLRPIDRAADDEFAAFLKYGGLSPHEVQRVRMEKEGIPAIKLNDYSGIIIGGGPSNVSDDETDKKDYQKRFEEQLKQLLLAAFESDFPVFGNCYGLGAIFKNYGGEVSKANYSEGVGGLEIELTEAGRKDPILNGLPPEFMALGGHKEACQDLVDGMTLLASSQTCPVQMIRIGANIYATQFHTELDVEGILLRIAIYKNHGYFSPNEAEVLSEEVRKCEIEAPFAILRNFIDKYRKTKDL